MADEDVRFDKETAACRAGLYTLCAPPPPQPFYGPFSGTTRVSQCQKRTSGLYGARED